MQDPPSSESTKRAPPEARLPRNPTTQDAADYIAQMSSELAVMARSSGFDLLAYLLEMVVLEANTVAKRSDSAR